MTSKKSTDNVKQFSIAKLGRRILKIMLALSLIAFLLFAWFVLWPTSAIPDIEPVDEYVYLDQGWGVDANSDARNLYYYTPQGASMPQGSQHSSVRYSWFVNLELPFSDERFASPEHMRKYRFIVDPKASENNPDQLPIGFTKHFNEAIGEDVLDITCAACHSGEIHYTKANKKYAIRIDGGQAMHAFTDAKRGNFAPVLLASMIDTWVNPWKFDRFAKGVLDQNYPNGKDALKGELSTSIKKFLSSAQNNPLKNLYPVEEGFGRTDALGRIGNTVFGDHLSSDNYQQGAAPVSFPYVWNIWKFDWVQYNGSVAQPLARNIGEALGVGAVIPLVDDNGNPLPIEQRFNSSVRIDDLNKIEATLRELTPPPWPTQILGDIDAVKAAQGKELFKQHCQGCHGPHPASLAQQKASAPLKQSPLDEWLIEVIEASHIGTDPTAADAFMDRRYDLSKTGITDQEITNTLSPLLLRKLNRDVQYRLTEVINLRKEKGLDVSELTRQLTQYPPPNLEQVPTYPEDNYQSILTTLSKLEQGVPSIDSITAKPTKGYSCNMNCQVENLIWLLKDGYKTSLAAAKTFKANSLTEGEALNLVGLLIKNKFYKDNKMDYAEQMKVQGYGTLDLPQQIRGYKPRPLAGVWATPPFLHNGSVPSVYQMLLPPEQRTKQFYMGSREYDPKHLGYVVKTKENSDGKGFLFDTDIKGNWNIGHAFSANIEDWKPHKQDSKKNPLDKGVIGPLLTDQERFAVIEFLKIKTDRYKCMQTSEQGHCLEGEWQ